MQLTYLNNRFFRCLATLLPALAVAGLTACGEEQADAGDKQATPVRVVRVRADAIRETVTGIGSVQSIRHVELQAELAGTVTDVTFVEGDPVNSGEMVIRLDDDELVEERRTLLAAREAAVATRDKAKRVFDRVGDAYEQEAAAWDEFANARSDYQRAVAEVDRLDARIKVVEEQIEDTQVVSPLDGVISRAMVDVGDFVGLGEHLATVYQLQPIEVAFDLPERVLGRLAEDQTVTVTTPAFPDESFEGRVVFISPAVDVETRTFLVKAELPNENEQLKSGLFANASVTVDVREQRPIVPEEALVSTRTGYEVFVVEDGKAASRAVTIGLRRPGEVEIREGVAVGERVVTQGHMGLNDGDRVQPGQAQPQPADSPEEPEAS